MEEEEIGTIVRAAYCSSEGMNHANEDTAFIKLSIDHPDGKTGVLKPSYVGVYDGHGGTEASAWMRDNAHKYILESDEGKNFFWPASTQDIDDLAISKYLEDVAFAIDKDLIDYLDKKGVVCGSCGLCIIQVGRRLFMSQIGDARVILGKKQPLKKFIGSSSVAAKALTEDQNTDNKKEVKRIESLGGYVRGGRVYDALKVTRAYGDPTVKKASDKIKEGVVEARAVITVHKIEKNDYFFISASDGLFDVWHSNQTCLNELRKRINKKQFKGNVQALADEYVRVARKYRRHTPDDLTAAIAFFAGHD